MPALAIGATLLLGACSSDGGSDAATVDTEATESAPTTAAAASPASVTVGETFYYLGFGVTLGEATLTPGPGGGVVTIAADFENRGSDTASFAQVAMALESAGETYDVDLSESELPKVPGDKSNNGVIAFSVDPSFTFDDAVLTVGNPDYNQAVVPLGATGQLVSNEPVEITAPISATAGEFTVDVTKGLVLFDDPINHRGVDAGHTIIRLDFDLTRTGGANPTTFIGTENLALQLPDGTTVAIIADGVSNPNELVAPDSTLKDLYARFEGDLDHQGNYVLIVKQDTATESFSGEGPFTV